MSQGNRVNKRLITKEHIGTCAHLYFIKLALYSSALVIKYCNVVVIKFIKPR